MEPNNESGLTSSYFLHPHQQLSTLSHPPSASNGAADGGSAVLYPQSLAGNAPPTPPVEPQRRKRGRPRKYGTPEAAAAAKRAYTPAAVKRKDKDSYTGDGSSNSSLSKPKMVSVAGGQGFTPHVISAEVGEDVGQKIMSFMQNAGRELCILSASGSVTNASLRQPDISGGNISYEGRFDIVSLSGSYVSSECGGKAGALSACLSSTNGVIIGGGIGGPLIAAGPVEVIVATFLIDPKKDSRVGFKGSKMPSPLSGSTTVYRPVVESSGEFGVSAGGDDHQNMDGSSPFMMQPQWRGGIDYDLGGNTGHDDSPENGDYEQ